MPTGRSRSRSKRVAGSASLMVRLDKESKAFLNEAAQLRRISVSAYVRAVTVAQARQEVLAARQQTIVMAPHEQLAFWNALQETPRLTKAQRRLAAIMQGRA